jgi:hypothetical protein
MPPYIRRRVFRGWDWFTPRAIQHLQWGEQQRLNREAWEAVRRHPRYRLMTRSLPLLGALAMGLAGLSMLLKWPGVIYLLFLLSFAAQEVTGIIWQRRRFRKALRQTLLDAGIPPRFCFECGYEVEGYQGNECPACDAPFLRQPESTRPMS